eukprot:TRINITY_DN18458_c1_g1_i2.p1 TRINITY_DN18458_c1_g1~~TRINITY_DN18458_c1_g1_i2.p1  ORF type:complete len:808 (+),score=133.35 TRINITY_DN18458_c1_g1_i2:1062-3485(+)
MSQLIADSKEEEVELNNNGSFGTLLDHHHVIAVDHPLKVFRPPDMSNPNNRVFYDECNDELIVVQTNNIQFSPLYRRQEKQLNFDNAEYYGQEVGRKPVRGAKRSLNTSLLAVLRNDKEIVFYRLGLAKCKPIVVYICKQAFQLGKTIPGALRRTNVVKDFFWLTDSVVLIITSTAIETFVITHQASSKQLQRLRHYATTVDYYSFNSRHKVLLCVNKDKPHLIKSYKIGIRQGISRYTKIKLEDSIAKEHIQECCRPNYSFAGEKMPLFQMMITRLYGNTCLLHLNNRQEIVVYTLKVATNSWEKTTVLDLYCSSLFSINVVDNLILVHNIASSLTMIYDHRVHTAPIAPPMSLGFGSLASDGSRIESRTATNLYNHCEIFSVHPDKILDLSGKLYGLVINLKAIVPTFFSKSHLLRFLLQRRGSKQEAIQCIIQQVRGNQPLNVIGDMFDQINSAMAKGIRESMRDRSKGSKDVGTRSSHSSNSSPPQKDFPSPETPAVQLERPMSPTASVSESSFYVGSPTGSVPGSAIDGGGGETESISPQSTKNDDTGGGGGGGGGNAAAGGSNVIRSFEVPDEMLPVRDALAPPLRYPFYSHSGDWYTSDHVLVIEQIDMWSEVFVRIHEEKVIDSNRFSSIYMEYSRSLSTHHVKLKDVLQRFLIDLLIYSDPPNYPKLHHYLQYHVIEDTIPIALQLLKFEDRYPPSFQLALDMLSREKAFPEIVEVLLSRGLLVRAVEIMIQYHVRNVDVQFILSKAATSSDPLVLYSLCELLRKYNLTVRGIKGFSEKERCPEFEEQYAKILGVPVC